MNVNTTEHLQVLFDGLVAQSEVVDAATRHEGYWAVECLEGASLLFAIYHEGAESVTLRAAFPEPAPENEVPTYEAMLQLNWLAGENHGIRLGLDEEGVPIQEMDLPIGKLDLPALRKRLEFFSAKSVFWTMLMAGGGLESEQAEQAIDQFVRADPSMLV